MNNSTFPNTTTPPPSLPYSEPLWYTVLTWLIAVVIIMGNGLVIYLIITRRRLHITNNYFILSLATADISTGVLIIPTTFACSRGLQCNFLFMYAVFNIFLMASVANICAMTIDRYISIVIPLKYFMYMTKKVVAGILCVVWGVPIFIAFLPLTWSFDPDIRVLANKIFDPIQILVLVVLPITLMLLVYARIFFIARRISKQTSQTQNQLRFNDSNANNQAPSQVTRKERRERRNREGSVAVIGAVIILFAICWIYPAHNAICQVFNACVVTRPEILAAQTFLHLCGLTNPIVYSILKKDIRGELLRLVRSTSRRREDWDRENSSYSTVMSNKITA